jgi:CHAD domain-containing protein
MGSSPAKVDRVNTRAASPSASEIAVAALSRCGAVLADAARRVAERSCDPVDAVHELRVAIRRTRAVLRICASSFDPGWLEARQWQLHDLGRVVGETRDLDVMLIRLEQLSAALPESDRASVAPLLSRLRVEREAAFQRTLGVLCDRTRFSEVGDLATIATRPPLAASADEASIDDLVAATRRQWRRLRKSVRIADETPSEKNLHLVRVRAKALRYSLETLEPILHSSARAHARVLVALQDRLGEMQDADVMEGRLRVVRETGQVDAFVLGELVGFERARKAWVRGTWRDEWERASRRRLRRWSR